MTYHIIVKRDGTKGRSIVDMDVEIDGIHPEESMQVMSLDVQGVVGVA